MVWGYFVWMSWHSLDLPSLWADVDPQAPAPKLYCVCRFDPCEMVSVRSLSWAGAHLPQTHGNLPFPVLHHHTRPPPFLGVWFCGSWQIFGFSFQLLEKAKTTLYSAPLKHSSGKKGNALFWRNFWLTNQIYYAFKKWTTILTPSNHSSVDWATKAHFSPSPGPHVLMLNTTTAQMAVHYSSSKAVSSSSTAPILGWQPWP